MMNNAQDTFESLLKNSSMNLHELRSPYAFNPRSDKVIFVCNPAIPTISACRFFQVIGRANPVDLVKFKQQAAKAGFQLIPTVDVDLDVKLKSEIKIPLFRYMIKLKISPHGNIRLVRRGDESSVSLHVGGDSGRLTVKAFEEQLFGSWKVDVSLSSSGNAILKLTWDGQGSKLELEGVIKSNNNGPGLTVDLLPVKRQGLIPFSSFLIAGEFGFKVEITGEWSKWRKDSYRLPENLFICLSELLDHQTNLTSLSSSAVIVIPGLPAAEKLTVAGVIGMLLYHLGPVTMEAA